MFTERAALAFALAVALATAHGALYRWVDENGRVQYSDTPPPKDKGAVQLSNRGIVVKKLDAAATHELPGSIVLDGTLGPERVYALWSREPIAAVPVVAALRAIGARGEPAIRNQRILDVRADTQASILIEKVTP